MTSINVPGLMTQVAALNVSEEESPQINYDQVAYRAPYYKYRQIQQNGQGSTLTIAAGSVTLSQHIIPNIPVNLAETYIQFDALFPQAVGDNNGSTVFTDCLPISTIRLQPMTGGEDIAYVQNAQIYSKVMAPLTLSMDEYQSRGGVYTDTALGTAFPISEITGCQPFQVIGTRITAQFNPSKPSDAYVRSAGAVSVAGPLSDNTSGVPLDEIAPQHLASGTFPAAAAATSGITVRYRFPLKSFAGTVLALDRTICFGQQMQLNIQWQPVTNWGFQSLITAVGATSLGVPVISGFYLFVAEDVSSPGKEIQTLANSSGLNLNVPYVFCSQFTAPAVGVQDIPTTITPATGKYLKRIMTVPTNSTNTLASTANLDNVAGVKWSGVQTYLNGSPIQDYELKLADGTLYGKMKPVIQKTPAGMGQRNYEINCFYVDNFSDCDDGSKWNGNDFKESGLNVLMSQNYSARYNITAAGTVYIFSTWLRTLTIRPTGMSWSA